MAPVLHRRGEHPLVRPARRTQPGLLKPGWDLFDQHGFGTVRALENSLAANVREALAGTTAARRPGPACPARRRCSGNAMHSAHGSQDPLRNGRGT
jgi:hypothetical protein